MPSWQPMAAQLLEATWKTASDKSLCINPFSTETGIFQQNEVKITVVDALAPYVARSSAAMILTI